MPRLFGGPLSEASPEGNENNMHHPPRNVFEISRQPPDARDLSEHLANDNTTNSISSYQEQPWGPGSPISSGSPTGPLISAKIHSINHVHTPTKTLPPTSKSPPPPSPARRTGSSFKINTPNSTTAEAHGGRFITLTSPHEPEISIPVKTPSTNNPHSPLIIPSNNQAVETKIPAFGTKYSPSAEQPSEKEDSFKTPTTSQSTTSQSSIVRHSTVTTSPNAQPYNARRVSLLEVRDIEVLLFSLILLLTIQLGHEIARRGERETVVLVVRPEKEGE